MPRRKSDEARLTALRLVTKRLEQMKLQDIMPRSFNAQVYVPGFGMVQLTLSEGTGLQVLAEGLARAAMRQEGGA